MSDQKHPHAGFSALTPSGSAPRAGIIGGGQLALMLGEAYAQEWIQPQHPLRFLTADQNAPVRRLKGPNFSIIAGEDRAPAALTQFFSELDLVLFENEFVDVPLLRECARSYPSLKFFPSLDTIELLQDKLRQKQKWAELILPTSPFIAPPMPDENESSVRAFLATCQRELGTELVLKWSRQGYDGKGVAFLRAESGSDLTAWIDFFARARAAGSEVFAEKFAPFEAELAIIGVRSGTQVESLPLVKSVQTGGTCLWVNGPYQGAKNPALPEQVRAAVKKIALACELHGCFGLELFLLPDAAGTWLINEIAPRVHNTGHYSQDVSFAPSQFRLHWRAALAQTLPRLIPEPTANFGMLNLLGPNVSATLPTDIEAKISAILPRGTVLHWYGKARSTPKRKLGHVNWVAATAQESQALQSELSRFIEDFHALITSKET